MQKPELNDLVDKIVSNEIEPDIIHTKKGSDYNDAIANLIIKRIIQGETLTQACSHPDAPNPVTFLYWYKANPVLEKKYKDAQEIKFLKDCENLSDEINNLETIYTSSTSSKGEMYGQNTAGVQKLDLKMRYLSWRGGMLNSAKYGKTPTNKITLASTKPEEQLQEVIKQATEQKITTAELISYTNAFKNSSELNEIPALKERIEKIEKDNQLNNNAIKTEE